MVRLAPEGRKKAALSDRDSEPFAIADNSLDACCAMCLLAQRMMAGFSVRAVPEGGKFTAKTMGRRSDARSRRRSVPLGAYGVPSQCLASGVPTNLSSIIRDISSTELGGRWFTTRR